MLAACAIGISYGVYSNACVQKWHNVGQQAYLASQSKFFEASYAAPSPVLWQVLCCLVATLILFIFYEGLAFSFAQVISAFARKPTPWES